ncbi:MAG: hypothetical protein M1497_13415 [Nitrospirae bacterium]|nr:hypothetical protein [Nitrospirota bacterium]
MRKIVITGLALALVCGFLFVGTPGAEAMNNESAAMLAGAIAVFGPPVLSAMTGNGFYREPVYSGAYYAPAYPVRTEVIYVSPGYRRHCGPAGHAYERGWRGEWRRHDYERGREHAGRYYRYGY